MQSNKPIQKKPKDRSNSPQHPKKEKAQKQDRYKFQLLPLPEKFVNRAKMYRLYGDLILMESDDNMIIDGSLYNYYKIYRRIEIESHESQRLVRVYLENKFDELEDWKEVVEKIKNSPSSSIREWAEPIKAYCERYEDMIKEFQGEMSKEKIAKFTEINLQTKKIRHALINTYPLVECKSEFRNGHIELTQLAYSEKFIAAIGFTLEELVNAVFKNGLPMLFPLTAVGASWIAKMGVEYSLPLEPEGFRAPEYDVSFFSKDGTIKSVKSFVQYNAFLEKGVPGFFCFSMMAEQPKDCTENIKPMEKQVLTKDYANKDYEKEMEHADFLELFYGIRTEPR